MAAAPGSGEGLRPVDPIAIATTGGPVNRMMDYLGNIGSPVVQVSPSSLVPALISDRPLQNQRQTEPTNNLTTQVVHQAMSQLTSNTIPNEHAYIRRSNVNSV